MAVHGALGAAQLEIGRLEAEVADCKSLAVAVIERLTAERDGLLATIERVRVAMDDWSDCGPGSQCSCCGEKMPGQEGG